MLSTITYLLRPSRWAKVAALKERPWSSWEYFLSASFAVATRRSCPLNWWAVPHFPTLLLSRSHFSQTEISLEKMGRQSLVRRKITMSPIQMILHKQDRISVCQQRPGDEEGTVDKAEIKWSFSDRNAFGGSRTLLEGWARRWRKEKKKQGKLTALPSPGRSLYFMKSIAVVY